MACIGGSSKVPRGKRHGGYERFLISVSGADTFALLQKLVTNDVSKLEQQWEAQRQAGADEAKRTTPPDAFYSAFLDTGGRIIAAAFMYPHPNPPDPTVPQVLLDCSWGNSHSLMLHLHHYRSLHKVSCSQLSYWDSLDTGPQVWALWEDEGRGSMLRDVASVLQQRAHTLWRDPRTPSMGYRFCVLSPASNDPDKGGSGISEHSIATLSKKLDCPNLNSGYYDYRYHRIRQGVPEGPREMIEFGTLPFEANLDLCGLDLQKSGYVGHMAMDEMRRRGIEKRILPVRVSSRDTSGRFVGRATPRPRVDSIEGSSIYIDTAPSGTTTGFQTQTFVGKLVALVLAKSHASQRVDDMPDELPDEVLDESLDRSVGARQYVGLASIPLDFVADRPGREAQESAVPATRITLHRQEDEEDEVVYTYSVRAAWPDWWPEDVGR